MFCLVEVLVFMDESNQKKLYMYIGTSCTDVCAEVLQVNGFPDQEESLHSPLPPPYSPLLSEKNPSSLIFSFKLVGDNID